MIFTTRQAAMAALPGLRLPALVVGLTHGSPFLTCRADTGEQFEVHVGNLLDASADSTVAVTSIFGADPDPAPAPRRKASHVGAPAAFALELECKHINTAFSSGYGTFLVGSALSRADWRDVDLRLIMPDDEFEKLFPGAGPNWESDERWLLLTVSISERLSRIAGLPVDFQFQPMTHANRVFGGERQAMGLSVRPRGDG